MKNVNPEIREFVNNWLWGSEHRRTKNMPWDNKYIEDVVMMISEYKKGGCPHWWTTESGKSGTCLRGTA